MSDDIKGHRTKGQVATGLYKPIAQHMVPGDAYDVLVLIVAFHMAINPRHQTRSFTSDVQEAMAQIKATGFTANHESRWLDPLTARLLVFISSAFMMTALGVFTVLLTISISSKQAELWDGVLVFLATYGLFVVVVHMVGLVRALLKL